MTTVDHFLSTTEIIDGALTPEQAAQVLDLAQEGDTAPVADLAGAPAPAPAEPVVAEETTTTTTEPDPDSKPDPEKDSEAEPAILAKDGKHLIAYEKLAEARESAKRAAAERDEAIRRAEELQAKLDAAAKEPAATEPEKGSSIADLRRERYNALLDGDLDKAIALEEKIEAEVKAQHQQVETAAAAFARVAQEAKDKYPALDLASDKADKDAIDFVVLKRDALIVQGKPAHEALAEAVGQAAKVFRWSNGQPAAPTPDPKAAAAAAAAVIANAKAPVPASLSAIPGGKPGGLSTLEQLAGKASGPEMLQVMENMTPEQIESFLNRSL